MSEKIAITYLSYFTGDNHNWNRYVIMKINNFHVCMETSGKPRFIKVSKNEFCGPEQPYNQKWKQCFISKDFFNNCQQYFDKIEEIEPIKTEIENNFNLSFE